MSRPLMWYVTLSKARRSRWLRQTPESLNSRENSHCGSENDETPVDGDSRPSLGACFQVEHRRVNETEWDTDNQLHVAEQGMR